MKSNLIICILGSVLSLSAAQVFTLGKYCTKTSTIKPFDLNKYLGDWYEIVKFKASFENGQKCVRANYQLKEDGRVRVDNSGYDAGKHVVNKFTSLSINGKLIEAIGDAYVPDENEPGRLKVRFSDLAPYGDYWVLNTDYETYTMIYSCADAIIGKIEFAWILSRERTLKKDIKDKLYQEIANYDVDTSKFMEEDQTNCPQV